MRDLDDEESNYNYSPNELTRLSIRDFDKYKRIVEANTGKSIDQWQRDNLEKAKDCLAQQRINRIIR